MLLIRNIEREGVRKEEDLKYTNQLHKFKSRKGGDATKIIF